MSAGRDLGANYQVGQRLGAGACGIVYAGVDKRSGEQVAIKFLREQYSQDTQVLTRFVSERTLLTAISHPRIVRVRDLVAEDGQLAIIMDYLPGPTLAAYLAEHTTLAPHLALTITSQTLAGLGHAHDHQLIHRDIKPDNIILTRPHDQEDPGVVITDFGIASILGASHSSMTANVGTANYMAPELIEDATIAASVDLYAVGITCYQMLTATTPFDSGDHANAFTIAHRHLTLAPPPVRGLGPKTQQFLDALLSKDPAQRSSVERLASLLQAAIEETIGQDPLPARSLDTTSYHQATILKPETTARASELPVNLPPKQPAISALPHLPAASTATVIKPQPVSLNPLERKVEDLSKAQVPAWKRIRIPVVAAVVVSVLIVILTWWLWPQSTSTVKTHSAMEASLEEPPLPSGLKIGRSAKWDSQSRTITYTVNYASIKTPIQGQVMEILSNTDGSCATPKWQPSQPGITATHHSQAMTSIKAECAWTVTLPTIGQSPFSLTATIVPDATPASQEDLQAWLAKQSQATTKALSDPNATSTAYPLQRLSGIRLQLPQRITQGKIIPIAIIGVWPGGENTLTPIYTSPNTGEPTSVVKDITASDLNGVHLSDRCSGAVSITPSGREVTALYPTTSCSISVQVGNYETEQTPITITTTGS